MKRPCTEAGLIMFLGSPVFSSQIVFFALDPVLGPVLRYSGPLARGLCHDNVKPTSSECPRHETHNSISRSLNAPVRECSGVTRGVARMLRNRCR